MKPNPYSYPSTGPNLIIPTIRNYPKSIKEQIDHQITLSNSQQNLFEELLNSIEMKNLLNELIHFKVSKDDKTTQTEFVDEFARQLFLTAEGL